MEQQLHNNFSGNISHNLIAMPEPEPEDDYFIENIAPYTLLAITIFGIIGNGFIIVIVLSNVMMRTVPNLFLVSVAIGDFILVSVCPPLRMLVYTNVEWTFGNHLCVLNEFIITLSQGVSIFTLTALAGDRFRAIVMPMRSLGWETKRKTISITVFIWFLAFLFALPDLLTSGVDSIQVEEINKTLLWCNPYHVFPLNSKEYLRYTLVRRLFNIFVYYVIPLAIITTMYITIACTLVRNLAAVPNMNLEGNVAKKYSTARKRVAKIVIILVICFIVCWTPRHVFIITTNYTSVSYDKRKLFQLMSFWLSFFNSCINPPVLYVMSSDFKRHFNHYFCFCFKSKREGSRHRGSDFGLISYAVNNNSNVNITKLNQIREAKNELIK